MAGKRKASVKVPKLVTDWPVINLRIDPVMLNELEEYARESGRKRQDAIRWAISEEIRRHQEGK